MIYVRRLAHALLRLPSLTDCARSVGSVMISDAARHLQAATTVGWVHDCFIAQAWLNCGLMQIAVRYAAVRRQSLLDEGSAVETQILDYNMLQRNLFPLVAAGYACHFAGMHLIKLYNQLQVGSRHL